MNAFSRCNDALMEPRTFFKLVLDRRGLNPSSAAAKMKEAYLEGMASGLALDPPPVQSVMSRFLKGSAMHADNAKKLGEFFSFSPAAIFDPAIADQEAERLGLVAIAPEGKTDRVGHEYGLSEARDTTVRRAPVFAWALLGAVLELEAHETDAPVLAFKPVTSKISSKGKFFVSPVDMPGFNIWAGWLILVDPMKDDSSCLDGRVYLFKRLDGSFFLGSFRRMLDGFEAFPEAGAPLTSAGHGIAVVGRYCGSQEA